MEGWLEETRLVLVEISGTTSWPPGRSHCCRCKMFPTKSAVITCAPTLRLVVEHSAVDPETVTTPEIPQSGMLTPSALKVTLPLGEGPLTVAVKVTLVPTVEDWATKPGSSWCSR